MVDAMVFIEVEPSPARGVPNEKACKPSIDAPRPSEMVAGKTQIAQFLRWLNLARVAIEQHRAELEPLWLLDLS
jgi:hypothetical protein